MRSPLSKLILVLVAAFILMPGWNSLAQTKLRKFDVTAIDGGPNNPVSQLEKKLVDVLVKSLLEKGGVRDYKEADWTFFVRAIELDGDEGKLIACITALQRLPLKVIELCKREQVFYAGYSEEKKASLPSEGKPVREMLSEEMMREYLRLSEQQIMVTSADQLENDMKLFVERLYRLYSL